MRKLNHGSRRVCRPRAILVSDARSSRDIIIIMHIIYYNYILYSVLLKKKKYKYKFNWNKYNFLQKNRYYNDQLVDCDLNYICTMCMPIYVLKFDRRTHVYQVQCYKFITRQLFTPSVITLFARTFFF